MLFLPFDLLNIVTSAKEDTGDFDGNARQKEEMTAAGLAKMSPQEREQRLRMLCHLLNVEYEPSRMFSCVEDGGVSLHSKLWETLSAIPDFQRDCPPEILESVRAKGNAGPGAETAPVLSAVLGVQRYMHYIQKALDKIRAELKEIPAEWLNAQESCKLSLTNILDPSTTADVRVTGEYQLNVEDNKLTAHPDPRHRLRTSYHYVKPLNNDEQGFASAAAGGTAFITCEHVRARALELIRKQIKPLQGHPSYEPLAVKDRHPLYAGIIGDEKTSGLPQLGDGNGQANGIIWNRLSLANTKAVNANADAVTLLSDIHPLIQRSDALVLMPVVENNLADRFRNRFYMDSIMVAKQTEPLHYQKPVLVVNDGSWDENIKLHTKLSNLSMTKDYVMPWQPSQFSGIRAYADQYTVNQHFQILDSRSKEYTPTQIGGEVRRWMEWHSKQKNKGEGFYANYNPRNRHYPPPPLENGARAKPYASQELVRDFTNKMRNESGIDAQQHPRMNVAVFCSASSQNAELNAMTAQLTEDLAAEGYGVIYGGADQYMMGQIRQGVLNYRNNARRPGDNREDSQIAYIGGVSTPHIVKKETVLGKGPENIHYLEANNIFERIAVMAQASDAFVIEPGGAGTLQELDALLYLKAIHHPSMMATGSTCEYHDKPIILINPEVGPDIGGKRHRFFEGMESLIFGQEGARAVRQPISTRTSIRPAPRGPSQEDRHHPMPNGAPRHENVADIWKNVFIVNNIQQAEHILKQQHKALHRAGPGNSAAASVA